MKVKTFAAVAALIAGVALASPSLAATQLSDDQLDNVYAGYFTYFDWYMPIAYPNSVNGYPYFYPGVDVGSIYMRPIVIW